MHDLLLTGDARRLVHLERHFRVLARFDVWFTRCGDATLKNLFNTQHQIDFRVRPGHADYGLSQ